MTLAAWPSELPKPVRAPYTKTWIDGRQMRAADYGPPSARLRSSAVVSVVAMSVRMDRDQRSVFEAFWQGELAWGTLPFTMIDPTTDGWELLDDEGAPVLDESGNPISLARTWTCLFSQDGLPEETMQGLTFNINFSVVVMP